MQYKFGIDCAWGATVPCLDFDFFEISTHLLGTLDFDFQYAYSSQISGSSI